MSGDEKFDDFVRREAAAYNRPREVPRDEMWEAIQARRKGGSGSGGDALGPRPSALGSGGSSSSSGSITPTQGRVLSFPSVRRWGLAAAAVLLLAFGIAIGRFMPVREVARDDVPVRVPPGPVGPPPEQQMATTTAPEPSAPSVESPSGVRQAPRATTPRERRSPATVASPDQQLASAAPGAEPRVPSASSLRGNPAYQQVMQQHLANSEQLLVAFRADARDGRIEADLSRFARTLLSSTRLLIDSPAGDDPRRRRMLEDLELVLVQIVHLAPDAPAEDRDEIGRAIEQGDVLTRLRNTVPAGVVSSGT